MFKYDITWIMQSYLGEYEGSRENADKKFIRAVKSFLAINEKDPRTQLVIASDGCEITHKLWIAFRSSTIFIQCTHNSTLRYFLRPKDTHTI